MAGDIPPKPASLPVDFEGIPSELQYSNQLVDWRYIWKEDEQKWDKPLFNPQGWKASTIAAHTWSPFTEVQKAYEAGKYDGVGFVVQKSPAELQLIGVDLDKCRDPQTGDISQDAKEDLNLLNSYSEISPSGTGIRIFVKGDIPQDGRNSQKKHREIYKNAHYLTITGQRIEGYPATIETRTAEVLEFYNKYFGDEKQETEPQKPTQTSDLSDDRIISLASGAKNGDKFRSLMAGSTAGYKSASEADEALAFTLAFYTGDESQIIRIIRRSGLWDEKWQRVDYQRRTIGNALRMVTEHYEPKAESIQIDSEHFTEGGNASRLVRLHGRDMRYCHTFRKWLIWNGQRWELDGNGKAMRHAEDVVRELYRWAAEASDKDTRDKIASFARACDSNKSLKNILSLASNRESIAITANDLNLDAWSLCAGSHTIDLKTCSVRDPRHEDLITKAIGTKYDPKAACNLWLKFLDRIFAGDQELISYIQRAVGYSLTGSMVEQIYFFCHGKGANGKSVFLAILRALLGDYAKQASFDTFLVQRNAKVRNDLAALAGARIITASEAEEGAKLSMQVIKSWTGGDPITARFLFAEDFTFKPVGKIWLAANHKPVISERNYAAWRRVHLIPFNVTIPKAQQDKELEKKLLEELPGILNWALEGLKEYHRTGLEPPEAVKAATEAYRRENDSLEAFIAECCEVRKLAVCKNSDLFSTYQSFCRMSGLEVISQRKFTEELIVKPGVQSKRDMHGMTWHGITLKPAWKPNLCRINQQQQANMQDMKENPQSFENPPSRENLADLATYPTYPTLNEAADNDLGKRDPTCPCVDEGATMGPNPRRDMPTPAKDGLTKFKAGMKKRHCLKCGRNFPFDLGIHWKDGYLCFDCNRGQTPEPNPQATLGDGEAEA